MKQHEQTPGDPGQVYREALRAGRFILQQCRDCGRFRHPPGERCDHCESPELRWTDATGRGEVYSIALDPLQAKQDRPYSVALVALEEGPRLLGRVMDVSPDDIAVGMTVSAHVGLVDGEYAVVFYNKEQGSQEW